VTDSLLRRISPNHRSRSSLRIRYVNRPPSAYKYGYTMITAAEYRAWADESLKWAREAATESEREACTKSAEVWLQSALRSERLSTEPDPTTEYVWQLPPFQKWRRKGTPTQIAHGNGPVRNVIGGALRRGDDYAHQRSAEIAGGVVSRGIGNAMQRSSGWRKLLTS
jgi:hypothetical protein